MNLSSVIVSLATGTYTVTRRQAATYSGPRLVPGATSTLSVLALVVPLSGRELERLPEGMRGRETVNIFTTVEMKMADGTYDPDLISVNGTVYEIQKVSNWGPVAAFWQSYASKVPA